MVNTFSLYILMVLVVLFLVMLAQSKKIAYPIVLVLGGLVISLIPGIPAISIDSEAVFIIFLPPLLYEAAWSTSWKDFWRWRRIIGSFAFLIVIITSLVVALVASWWLPGFTLALGFLLGGIVSPPDAVSATAIMRHVKVPKRMTAILEGESLMNDASSLIVFRFALIAVDTGHFVFHEAAISFVVVITMGILVGLAIGMIYYAIHRWMPTTADIDTVLTFTAPYAMYLVAEKLHVSGVLAVVSGGLYLSARHHHFLSTTSRLRGVNVWASVGFVLNGLVFILIGLELPVVVEQLGDVSLMSAIGYGCLITGVLIVARMLSGIGAMLFTVFISRYITTADSRPGWRAPLIIGWTGMRGVVSLAAALSIPLTTSNGLPFPQRNMILFVTFMVILLTLVVQGLSLPWVIRVMDMGDPDHMLPTHEQDVLIHKQLTEKSIAFLDKHYSQEVQNTLALHQLREKLEKSLEQNDPIQNPETDTYKHVYLSLIDHKREWLHSINKHIETDEAVVRKQLGLLDLEEEQLRIKLE